MAVLGQSIVTGMLCASPSMGRSGGVDSETINVGIWADKFATAIGYSSGLMGTIADGLFVPKGGAAINGILWSDSGVQSFALNGLHANDGWETLDIEGATFSRAAASYFQSGGFTYWQWSAANPFSTLGVDVEAVFS